MRDAEPNGIHCDLVNSDMQKRMLLEIKKNNGISVQDAQEVYSHPQSFYKAINNLENTGLVKRRPAPKKSTIRGHVWTLTDMGRNYLKYCL